MTDDVTRGLSMLADEADSAPIDTDAVIATATARTRNRAILATAFVTVFLVSALVLTLGAVKPDSAPIADRPTTKQDTGPTAVTPWRDNATPAEREARKARLHTEITAAFDRILPSGWDHSTFDFDCSNFHCWALGDILNSGGTVSMSLVAWGKDGTVSCQGISNCVRTTLEDGTFVTFSKRTSNNIHNNQPETVYVISAQHPDGTTIGIDAKWPTSRSTPTLTDEQWLEFATAYSYF